jgi:hypothetical protein
MKMMNSINKLSGRKFEILVENIFASMEFKLKKQLNKTYLTQKDMNLYGEFSSSVYERRFGGWNKFLSYVRDKII